MKKDYILIKAKWGLLFQGIFLALIFVVLLFLDDGSIYSNLVIGIGLLNLLIFSFWGYKEMLRPIKTLNKACQAFAGGYIGYDIFNQNYKLNKEHDEMMQKMHNIIEQKELVELYRSQAEYLALQNQINPHFLYNTLEGIRSEALIGGLPAVGEMAEVLAKFFRYTISNVQSMVSVEDEVSNVQHYCRIQKYRFGDKISLKLLFEKEEEENIKKSYMPKLILQPIVENAIRHGIEPLLGNGIVAIRFQRISDRLNIFVSDNGVGMKEEDLKKLNKKLRKIQLDKNVNPNQEGGIAMVNVNNRIKLLFGEDFGIRFYSTEMLGTDVEVSLPFEDTKPESAGRRYEEGSTSY